MTQLKKRVPILILYNLYESPSALMRRAQRAAKLFEASIVRAGRGRPALRLNPPGEWLSG
jgi:hypothetical protein